MLCVVSTFFVYVYAYKYALKEIPVLTAIDNRCAQACQAILMRFIHTYADFIEPGLSAGASGMSSSTGFLTIFIKRHARFWKKGFLFLCYYFGAKISLCNNEWRFWWMSKRGRSH